MIERWIKIRGYNDVYEVSNLGKVRRVKSNRYAKAKEIGFNSFNGVSRFAYRFVVLSKNKVKKKYAVHRLVAKYFIGNPTKKRYDINHKDGNPLNNIFSNLEYCSAKENTHHAIINNLRRSGPNYKLTDKEKRLIIKEYSAGNINQTKLGQKYGVCQVTISKILTNHLTANK